MDTIAIIIVTAFINITITSAVSIFFFSRFQKNIELSFSKKLEEYKASLQYSNFEQQTKFVRNHAKAVETLEGLYQKFVVFVEEFGQLTFEVQQFYESSEARKLKIDFEDVEYNRQKMRQFWMYFEENRLFLSLDVIQTVTSVFIDTTQLHTILMFSLPTHHEDNLFEFIKSTAKGFEGSNLYERVANLEKIEKSHISLILSETVREMHARATTLDYLYKSVAGATGKEDDS